MVAQRLTTPGLWRRADPDEVFDVLSKSIKLMAKIILLAIATAPLMVVLSNGIARAETPEGGSMQLLPLENRSLVVEVDANYLQTAAQEINTSTFGGKETSGNVLDLGEALGVDEDGSTRLPLGIRVFSTLGDPSIGFGGDF